MSIRLHSKALAALLTLLLALVVPACGSDDGGGGGGGGDGSNGDAAELLDKALKKQVDTADVKLDFSGEVKAENAPQGPIKLSLEGPYKSNGQKALPSLDWKVAFEGSSIKLDGRLIVTENNAFVEYQGRTYEVGTALYDRVSKLYAQQSQEPLSLDALGLEPASWFDDPEVGDGDDIGGDSTQKVSGAVDVGAFVKDLSDALQSPALKQRLEAQGSPVPKAPTKAEIKEAEETFKKLTVALNVDEDDFLRRLALEGDLENPDKPSEQANGSFDVTLESVNEGADIKAPSKARPITELLQQFRGLGGGGLGGGRPDIAP